MAFSRTTSHTTSADATFSAAGTAAWNGTGAHTLAVADAVSGGIPYFSSTTTEGTSALLAANAVVLGGGAGTAPFTDAGLTYDPSTDVLSVTGKLALPSTGANTGGLSLGVAGGANSFTIWQHFNGSAYLGVNYAEQIAMDASGLYVLSNGRYNFSSSTTDAYATQTNISQQAAGVLQIGTTGAGSTGSLRCKYQSSDGTAGVSSFGPAAPASITVKDGIVVAIS